MHKHFPFFDPFTFYLINWTILTQSWLSSVSPSACYSSQSVEEPSGENCMSMHIGSTANVCFSTSAGPSTLILNLFLICSWLLLSFPTTAVSKLNFSSQVPLLAFSLWADELLFYFTKKCYQVTVLSFFLIQCLCGHSSFFFSSPVSLNSILSLLTFSYSLQMFSSLTVWQTPNFVFFLFTP